MERQNEGQDRISELPTFILHQILDWLPRKDVAKVSALSKEWNSVWKSYPLQTFVHTFDIADPGRFADSVDESLQRFMSKNLVMLGFNLHFFFLHDPEIVSRVDQWIELLLRTGIHGMCLDVGSKIETSRGFMIPSDYVIPEQIFSSRFPSLRQLYLFSVRMSYKAFRQIVDCCPNIEDLMLRNVSGMKTLGIPKHNKLRFLRVEIGRGERAMVYIDIDAPNLTAFHFTSLDPNLFCLVRLHSCLGLTDLSLNGFSLSGIFFHNFISQFPCLKHLEIVRCQALTNLKIAAQQLKCLRVYMCKNIKRLEIDAPNLSLFKWQTNTMPMLFSKNFPCPAEIFYLIPHWGQLSTSWFRKFRQFLGASKQENNVRIFCAHKESNFNLNELDEDAVSPPFKVNLLQITSMIGRSSMDYATLIDALLWSCHPNIVSVTCDARMDIICRKAICAKLLTSQVFTCCDSSTVKCWRHDLKSVELIRCGDIEDNEKLLKWNHLLDTMPLHGKGKTLGFKLAWNF